MRHAGEGDRPKQSQRCEGENKPDLCFVSLKNSALYYKLWKHFLSEYKYKYVQSFI